MVDRAGASQDAPVSNKAGKVNPVRSASREFDLSAGGIQISLVGGATMATILTPDCDLLTIPFSAATDFTDLADCCDRFAEILIECHDPAQKLALLGRIGACLALLRPTLGEPIPPHLIGCFTVEKLPDVPQHFEPDAEVLCDYCQSLTQLLCQQSLLPEAERTLTGLLCELVWFFAADLKAPRWAREKLDS
ncbi:hypothetical protein EGM70_16240 [Enterobacteriaceae bacterium 89]|nr:hypothetical protein [Enterobacteriaceae bacterium 89]